MIRLTRRRRPSGPHPSRVGARATQARAYPDLVEALLAPVAAAGISGVVAFAIYAFHAMRADFNGLRSQFNGLRGDFADLRGEFADLRGEFADLRTEVRSDIAGLREEIRQGFTELRAELARSERAPR
jgi:hypothetical protein